jgi:NADP-dependent aldehyde dehydrogenase
MMIGAELRQATSRFHASYPADASFSADDYSEAGAADIADACALAEAAFPAFSTLSSQERAAFLEAVAIEIEAIGDVLIETAMRETGLPRVRLEGERGRTTGQLRLFAEEVRNDTWRDTVVDAALPDRQPLPRPDIRRSNQAIGPVAVYGASNFPLAFSVAGGDTASAFAAGCPVVVKGHPAHPGTGELVARAIAKAVSVCGLPAGTFSYLPGTSRGLFEGLASDPRIQAVGFTGSRAGGLALSEIAAKRTQPIPVFAEMSSINPVLLMPAALDARAEELGKAFAASLTMGAGQFCTNPGLIIALGGPALDRFVTAASTALQAIAPQTMLSAGIHSAYSDGVAQLSAHPAAEVITSSLATELNACAPALFATDAHSFRSDQRLGHEVFGAAALVVRCLSLDEIAELIFGLEGQLTATIHLDAEDEPAASKFVPLLAARAGRVLANGWPTGVEVCRAMVHGGPYPATTDGRTTSVGTLSMKRFLRPVCYQNMPISLLPQSLQPRRTGRQGGRA